MKLLKNKELIVRIIVDITLLSLLLIVPWWVFWMIVVFAIFYFNSFFEAIFFGLIADYVYGLPGVFILSSHFFTFSSLLLFLVVEWFKKRIIVYR